MLFLCDAAKPLFPLSERSRLWPWSGGAETTRWDVPHGLSRCPDDDQDMTAEGDRVAVRWTARGTQTGEMMEIPATGKPTTVTGMFFNRLAAGKIVEGWGNFDALGMLQQLGVIPTPEHVGA